MCIVNLERLISISNVGTFRFEEKFPCLKLFLQGMTTTQYRELNPKSTLDGDQSLILRFSTQKSRLSARHLNHLKRNQTKQICIFQTNIQNCYFHQIYFNETMSDRKKK